MKQLVSLIGTRTPTGGPGGRILSDYTHPLPFGVGPDSGDVAFISNAENWKQFNEGFIVRVALTGPHMADIPYSTQAINAIPAAKGDDRSEESQPGPFAEFLDKEFTAHSEQDVSKAREQLAGAINAALEDGRGEISDETALTAAELLGVAEQYKDIHEVLTYITSDNDAITKVTDWLGNYVVMKSRSFEDPVVHFKIRGYKECVDSDQAKDVAHLFLSCLKQKPTDA